MKYTTDTFVIFFVGAASLTNVVLGNVFPEFQKNNFYGTIGVSGAAGVAAVVWLKSREDKRR